MTDFLTSEKGSTKRVVIFYPHIGEYGGIERNIIGLATEVLNRGFKPILLCYYDHIDISKYAGFAIETCFLKNSWNPFVKSYRLRRWVHTNQLTIGGNIFVFGGKAGYYAGLAFLDNYVLHYTDPPSLLSSKVEISNNVLKNLRATISNSIIYLGVKRAALCITMTHQNAVELEAIYSRNFLVVYQGGVPPVEAVNYGRKCIQNKLVLFSICRLSTSKNLDWILHAVASFRNNLAIQNCFSIIEVIIAGKGQDLDRLKKLVETYQLQGVVRFPGFLDTDTLELAYQAADVFLVPGRQGYGLPILEALYRGVPVVMNVASRVSEILQENSWVSISADNVSSFSNCLVKHILSIRQDALDVQALAELPTEAKWASEIGSLCKWW